MARHYLSLSVRELMEDVLHHYKINVWPQVEAIIAAASTDTSKERVILEGSALWPGFAATLNVASLAAVWLTASDEVFEQRIRAGSLYRTKSRSERILVERNAGASGEFIPAELLKLPDNTDGFPYR